MKKPFLLLIDGMTGAGKSTVANLLAEKIPRVAIVGMDRVKRFISDFKRGLRDNSIARDITIEMTKKYLDHNISVIVDQPIKEKSELKQYENIARKYSIPIYKVQLFTSPKLAFKRILDRQKKLDIKVPITRIKKNISLYKNKGEEGFVAIDTSKKASKEVVKDILKLLSS